MNESTIIPADGRCIIQNHHIDSTRWNDFPMRADDIIIATYAKAGTTWLQQIVGQLVFNGAATVRAGELSPWLDMRIMPREEVFAGLAAQTNRRFIKSHLPLDALPWSTSVKYLYVARDLRDLIWSLHRHHSKFTPLFIDLLNNTPGRVGPEITPVDTDIVRYYRNFLERDGDPFWAFWSHIQSWWDARNRANVQLVHFNNLKADLEGEIRRIAAFLDIAIDEKTLPVIVEHSTFDWMKRAANAAPHSMINDLLTDGLGTLVHKGTNGRWKNTLSANDAARADQIAAEHLSPDCVHWLRTGQLETAG